MNNSLRTTALALVLASLAAAPALAQTARPAPAQSEAAATLPNTFDAPPRASAPASPAPQPATDASRVSEIQLAAAALESVIGQFKAGDIDETLFTPEVAGRLNSQLSTYRTMIDGFGPLQSIEPQGVSDGLGQFLIIFDNAATQWQIGLNEDGQIAALRFREAPPESSEPAR